MLELPLSSWEERGSSVLCFSKMYELADLSVLPVVFISQGHTRHEAKADVKIPLFLDTYFSVHPIDSPKPL